MSLQQPFQRKSKVRASLIGGDQSIPSTTDTKILFDNEEFDVDNEFSTGTFTAKTAGYYLILLQVVWPNSELVDGKWFQAKIKTSAGAADSLSMAGYYHSPKTAGGCGWSMTFTVEYLAVGGTIEGCAYQDTGVNKNVEGGPGAAYRSHTYICIVKLA